MGGVGSEHMAEDTHTLSYDESFGETYHYDRGVVVVWSSNSAERHDIDNWGLYADDEIVRFAE